MRHIALGSKAAVSEALEVFRGRGPARPRRIRLIGPIAVRATGPKTFTLVEEKPPGLEKLVVNRGSLEGNNLFPVFSKRPSLQFDEDAEVSASYPQIRSLESTALLPGIRIAGAPDEGPRRSITFVDEPGPRVRFVETTPRYGYENALRFGRNSFRFPDT